MPALVFLVMVAYVPGIPSATTAGRWAVMAAAPLLLLARPLVNSPPGLGHWAGAAFLVWAASSLSWSVSPQDTFGALLQLAALAAAFLLGAAERDLTRVWGALLLGAAVSLPFAAAQFFGYAPVQDALRAGFWTNGVLVSGLFLSRDPFVQVAVVAAIAAIGLGRYWCAAVFLVATYAAGGRTAIAMLGAAGLVWALNGHRRAAWIALAAVATVVIVALTFAASGSGLNRAEIWATAVSNFSILGAGLGTFKAAWPSYGFAHNEFLQLGFELGVGSLLLIVVIIHAFRCPERVLEKALLGALLAAAVVWQPFQLPATALVAAVLLGHLCAGVDRVRRAELEGGVVGVRGVQRAGSDGRGEVCPSHGSWPNLSV